MKRRSLSIDEYTYVNPRLRAEVMVRREVGLGGRIVDVYTDRNASFLAPAGRRGVFKIDPDVDASHNAGVVRWKPGRNPSFVHATHTGAAYGFLCDNGFTSGGEDPDEMS